MIKPHTPAIKKALETLSSYRFRNDFMKDRYDGETCYVISCGPTLMEFDFQKVREKLKNEMVVCIKQSFDQFKDICDIHIYNCANIKRYDYSNVDCISVESTSFGKILNPKCHLKYHILERRTDKSVSATKEFDKWTLDNVYERPYGPGIIYETVFYFLKHLGVKEIITLGWDNTLRGTNKDKVHFYDLLKQDRTDFVQGNDQMTQVPWESLTKEEQITVGVMGDWYEWLKSHDIELKIISHTNPAPSSIPRLDYSFINGV